MTEAVDANCQGPSHILHLRAAPDGAVISCVTSGTWLMYSPIILR